MGYVKVNFKKRLKKKDWKTLSDLFVLLYHSQMSVLLSWSGFVHSDYGS